VPSSCSPLTLAKFASAICPRACVLPLLNDPVIVPSPPIVKFTSEPLLLPSWSIAEAELGAATCAISGLVPLSTFQLKVWFVAPSAKPVIGIAVDVGQRERRRRHRNLVSRRERRRARRNRKIQLAGGERSSHRSRSQCARHRSRHRKLRRTRRRHRNYLRNAPCVHPQSGDGSVSRISCRVNRIPRSSPGANQHSISVEGQRARRQNPRRRSSSCAWVQISRRNVETVTPGIRRRIGEVYKSTNDWLPRSRKS